MCLDADLFLFILHVTCYEFLYMQSCGLFQFSKLLYYHRITSFLLPVFFHTVTKLFIELSHSVLHFSEI